MCISTDKKNQIMLVKTFGSAVYGVDAATVTIEVNICKGQHYFMVGLPDNAVKESWSRVESALRFNKYHMPRIRQSIGDACHAKYQCKAKHPPRARIF